MKYALLNVIIVLVGATIFFALSTGVILLATQLGYAEEGIILYALAIMGLRFYIVRDKRHNSLLFRLMHVILAPTKR
jgi:hypothetical protein